MNYTKETSATISLNRRQLKSQARRSAFRRGIPSWLRLVLICALFSFIGSTDHGPTAFIHSLDSLLGLVPEDPVGNVELLKEYLFADTHFAENPLFSNELILVLMDRFLKNFTWLINLFAANSAYLARNAVEVWGYLLLASLVSAAIRLFVQNALIVGKHRYVMEQRFQKNTLFRRSIAPFHRKYLFHIVWVLFRTNLCLSLWWFTIIGGFCKTYQYRMIPYLLAENPSISFRDAMRLSKEMTRGNKRNLFLLDLSCWYLFLIKQLPVVGLLIALPYEAALSAEVYFFLRRNCKNADTASFFWESAFDVPAFSELSPASEDISSVNAPAFLLPDIIGEEKAPLRQPYLFTDLLLLFFLFCFAGWLWEVSLHLVQHHTLVNRGTMYGPWIPIYGIGGIACILLLDRYKKNLPKTFFLIMLTAGILEFFISWGLDFFLNSSYWNYNGWFANLNGRICLAGLLAFGLGGSLAIYIVGPYVKKKAALLSPSLRRGICILFSILFCADLLCCLLFGLNSGSGIGKPL